MHILATGGDINGTTQVLYKKQGGSAGLLGGGSFGAVHLEIIDSECEAAPAVRAVKTINKRAAEASRIHWQQEVENLIVLSQYANLFVKVFGWWEDDKSILLPMEYFEASDLSRNRDYVRSEEDIRTISQQLAMGLHQMHSLDIIHRDIKPQNVFVVRREPSWHVKIGDFGFSKRVSDSVSAPFSARGTMKYMAPEYRDLMNNCESSDFTAAVDIWSFGCLIYELFARRCPFDENDTQGLMKFIRDGMHHTTSAPPDIVVVPDSTSDDASSSVDKSHRPSLTERAMTGPERPRVLFSADDATLPQTKIVQAPNLPVRPRSSNSIRSEPTQGIQNLQLADYSNDSRSIATAEQKSTEESLVARSAAVIRKPVAKPSTSTIFPYIKISRLGGGYIDMAFKNLKFKSQRKPTCDVCESRRVFNPVIKPAALFICKDCDQRPLCARCIVETIRNSADPHHADHKLQAWIQAHAFPLQEFLERFQPLDIQSTGGVDPMYGKSWLSSDHSFTPPVEGSHGTRWILNAPAGEFDISIQVRIAQQPEAIESPALSVHKSMMVKTKAVPLGSVLFGAQVLEAGHVDNAVSSRHLPDRPIEQSIKVAKEDQTITLKLGFQLSTTTTQKVEVHVRGYYDAFYFKAGSPFKWWLDQMS
ncbi:MAG: hypothetical protein Q9222_003137 [Ikaeria aurantiellina]